MKKRIFAVLMTAILAMSLTACGGGSEETTGENNDYKVGLVTDLGGVEDQSFNQSAWEGLQKAEKAGKGPRISRKGHRNNRRARLWAISEI